MVTGIGLKTSSRDGNISRMVLQAESAGSARTRAVVRYRTVVIESARTSGLRRRKSDVIRRDCARGRALYHVGIPRRRGTPRNLPHRRPHAHYVRHVIGVAGPAVGLGTGLGAI